jgi:glycopeptide antibiotics resistance protein
MERVMERLRRALSPELGGSDVIDGLRNAALFAGFGVIWAVSSRRQSAWRVVLESVAAALLLSAVIEFVQLWSPRRTSSVLDVMIDTAGAFIGVTATAAVIEGVRRSRGGKSWLRMPTWFLAGAYSGAVLAEATGPLFRQEQIPLSGNDPIARLRTALFHAPIALTSWYVAMDLILDAMLFAPAGALWVIALRERGVDGWRAVSLVGVAGAACFTGAELLHGIFGWQIVPIAIAAHTLGVLFGAVLAQRLYQRNSGQAGSGRSVRFVRIGYASLLILWSTRPFLPSLDLQAIVQQLSTNQIIPMLSLAGRRDLYSVMHVIRQTFLYVPAGAILAVWPVAERGWMAHLLPVVYAAILLELTHLVIEGRFFDTTNIILASAGAAVGWVVMRAAGIGVMGRIRVRVPTSSGIPPR